MHDSCHMNQVLSNMISSRDSTHGAILSTRKPAHYIRFVLTLSLPVSSLLVLRRSVWVTVFCLGKVILLHSEAVWLYCNR